MESIARVEQSTSARGVRGILLQQAFFKVGTKRGEANMRKKEWPDLPGLDTIMAWQLEL